MPNTGHGVTQGKVQIRCNITEKLVLPKSRAHLQPASQSIVPAARGDASLLLSPSEMGSSYRESLWLGLIVAIGYPAATRPLP